MAEHPVLPIQLGYIGFTILVFLMMVVFVPRPFIRKAFWFSLLWGTTVDTILVLLFQAIRFYQYLYIKPFDFLGTPMWNALAWVPAMIMFLYFLPELKQRYIVPAYIGAYSMVGVFVGAYYAQLGLIKEIHFHYLMRFPIWYLWFSAALWHYRKLYGEKKRTEWK